MQKTLAYHEAGHYVMNVLLRQIKFPIQLEVNFPVPKSIWINEKRKEGETKRSGFPIQKWTEESRIEVAGYLLNFPKFYNINKRLTVGMILMNLAGFASDSNFASPERVNFGHVAGEHSDSHNFSLLLPLILPPTEGRISDSSENAKIASIRSELILSLKAYFNLPEVADAIHIVAKRLMDKPIDENGDQRIEGREIWGDLDIMVEKSAGLRKQDLEEMIDHFVSYSRE